MRWRNHVTGRQNYVLLFAGADGLSASLFNAAARFGEDLQQVREQIVADALNKRSPYYREAVFALQADVAHFGMGSPQEAVMSARMTGEKELVGAVMTCPSRRQPTEDAVNAYLQRIQPGLSIGAMHYFHATRFGVIAVKNLRTYLRQRKLGVKEAVLLLSGFRVPEAEDPILYHARALGCPEARFPTRESGVVHLCGGMIGSVAAQMWNTMPVTTLVGPASLYVDFLKTVGALEAAEQWSVGATEQQLAVCELDLDRSVGLYRGVVAEESAANDWFWEQKRRPSQHEELLIERLIRRAALRLQDSVAPAGVTLRAASRKNRAVVPTMKVVAPISSADVEKKRRRAPARQR